MNKLNLRLLFACVLVTLAFICVGIFSFRKEKESVRYVRDVLRNELLLQESRRGHIKNVCSQLNPVSQLISNDSSTTPSNKTLEHLNSLLPYMDHFIIDDTHKMIYCFVPKVASTNWKRVLMALNQNKNIDDNPLLILGNETHAQNLFKTLNRDQDVEQIYHKLRTYLKFMFVRDPFERLLSAYRNKFEITWSDYFRVRFGRKIVKHLRVNATKESLERGHDVTFTEFLTYVLNLNKTQNKVAYNEHWRPIYDLCFPCLVDYNVIGKTETLVDDADLVLWKTRELDSVKFPRRDQTYNSVPTSILLKKYYEHIDADIMKSLAALYSKDLELFSYNKSVDVT